MVEMVEQAMSLMEWLFGRPETSRNVTVLAHRPENRTRFRKARCADSKSYSDLCASEKTRGAVEGRPVLTGAPIKTVPRVAAVAPKEAEPISKEEWDRLLLGQTLVDTLVPHARNPAPFSTHELGYFTNKWIAAMPEDDRRLLSEILMRNRGKRDFNRRHG
ncbi:hypothetical protein I6F11_27750 [Ensifer sp. NBAIM29]|nr:hypothetical protein [Ensifer sp. NBAIM29]